MTSMKKIFILTAFFVSGLLCFAERMGLDGYNDLSMDFPEGFQVQDMAADGKTVALSNTEFPLYAQLKVYSYGKYGSTQRCIDDTFSKNKIKGTTKTVDWRNQKCTFAQISSFGSSECAGYAAAFTLPYDKGTLFFITWCDKTYAKTLDCMMASLMDSIVIDAGSYLEEGIYTAWKYPDKGQLQDVELEIDGKKITTKLYSKDHEIAAATVQREYEVICLYQNSTAWKEAWQRYYRMIFKDSFKRLQFASFDIYNALMTELTDETDLAQKLLTWTQGFSYEREKNDSDFADLPSILLGGGSDCDSRSMLLAVLLTQMNQDAVIFVSAQYSHAMAGFVSTHPGHSFTVDGKKYLMGETTSKGLTWGKIPSDMDNQANWITVEFF